MHYLRESGQFAEMVRRLGTESASALAAELGWVITEIEDALAECDEGGAISETPGWPEIVRRIEGGMSLRDTARRFQTSPRRIRRGLARAGIRVGGESVGEEGVAALAAVVERLGKEPDAGLARECGVTVEAVQGERRRRGVEAFRPAPLERDEFLFDGPERRGSGKKDRPPKVWQREEVETHVVQRRSRMPSTTATPAVSPTGFASGLKLPTLKPMPASDAGVGEREWAAAPAIGKPARGTTRRRIVRNDADPIARAMGKPSKVVEPDSAPARTPGRTTRRRRVVRSEDPGDPGSSDPARPRGVADGGRPPVQAVAAPAQRAAPERRSAAAGKRFARKKDTPEAAPVGKDAGAPGVMPGVQGGGASAAPRVPAVSSVLPRLPALPMVVAAPASGPSAETPCAPVVLPTVATEPSDATRTASPPSKPIRPKTPVVRDGLGTQAGAEAVVGLPAPSSQASTAREEVRSVAPPMPRLAPVPTGPPLLLSVDRLRRLVGGGSMVHSPALSVSPQGLHGDRSPELWRVRAGGMVLPLVVLAEGMVEAIGLVQPHLRPDQLHSLSIWSEGQVGDYPPVA